MTSHNFADFLFQQAVADSRAYAKLLQEEEEFLNAVADANKPTADELFNDPKFIKENSHEDR